MHAMHMIAWLFKGDVKKDESTRWNRRGVANGEGRRLGGNGTSVRIAERDCRHYRTLSLTCGVLSMSAARYQLHTSDLRLPGTSRHTSFLQRSITSTVGQHRDEPRGYKRPSCTCLACDTRPKQPQPLITGCLPTTESAMKCVPAGEDADPRTDLCGLFLPPLCQVC